MSGPGCMDLLWPGPSDNTDHEATSSSLVDGKTGYPSFSLRGRSYMLNITGFPGGLWVQGPLGSQQLWVI